MEASSAHCLLLGRLLQPRWWLLPTVLACFGGGPNEDITFDGHVNCAVASSHRCWQEQGVVATGSRHAYCIHETPQAFSHHVVSTPQYSINNAEHAYHHPFHHATKDITTATTVTRTTIHFNSPPPPN